MGQMCYSVTSIKESSDNTPLKGNQMKLKLNFVKTGEAFSVWETRCAVRVAAMASFCDMIDIPVRIVPDKNYIWEIEAKLYDNEPDLMSSINIAGSAYEMSIMGDCFDPEHPIPPKLMKCVEDNSKMIPKVIDEGVSVILAILCYLGKGEPVHSKTIRKELQRVFGRRNRP